MKANWFVILVIGSMFLITGCRKKESAMEPGVLHLSVVRSGTTLFVLQGQNSNIAADSSIYIVFNNKLDTASVRGSVILVKSTNIPVKVVFSYSTDFTTIRVKPVQSLEFLTGYTLRITTGIKGTGGETFPGIEYTFTTGNGFFFIKSITLNQQDFSTNYHLRNIDFKNTRFDIRFSEALDTSNYKTYFVLSGNVPVSYLISDSNRMITVTNTANLSDYSQYSFTVSGNLLSKKGLIFGGFTNYFFTQLDSTPKFPLLTDDQLLTLVQKQTFSYFWDLAHPACGMARERNTSEDIVATGGSGFGVMAIIVGMERGFITREQGLTRVTKIINFLETCDRFHGAWPHWLNGNTGKTIPFSANDDGADLVETSYMVEGLITLRQYLNASVPAEQSLITRINALTDAVEYDWFTRGQNVLYWHWSPDLGWIMNFQIRGYNETLITYIVAATSTTHPIPAAVYTQGYARNGGIKNGKSFYGILLPLGEDFGGPLFFTHYSFLGLDPRTLQDQYANYWEQNVNQSLINWTYCTIDPKSYIGYSQVCWGLTASETPTGYGAQSPNNDIGVITPTAAVSSLPYTPVQSLNAIRFFYYTLGNHLWGNYGFYDAFDPTVGWWDDGYLAIDEGPMVGMIENYRTQLLWNLFMSSPEVRAGLTKLGFTY